METLSIRMAQMDVGPGTATTHELWVSCFNGRIRCPTLRETVFYPKKSRAGHQASQTLRPDKPYRLMKYGFTASLGGCGAPPYEKKPYTPLNVGLGSVPAQENNCTYLKANGGELAPPFLHLTIRYVALYELGRLATRYPQWTGPH